MFSIADRQKITSQLSVTSNANLIYVSETFKDYVNSSFRGEDLANPDYAMFSRDGEPMSFVVSDACVYGVSGRLFKTSPDRYHVRWVQNPDGFRRGENGWEALIGEESLVIDAYIPKAGYVEFTNDGLYRELTGIPFSTVQDRLKALESWTTRGFDREIVDKMVSYFMAGDNYPEAMCVGKWSGARKDSGPYEIDVNLNPGFAGQHMGALIQKL
ncbi:MAG: hypothetical protein JW789_05155 [Candidatus Aenigmarchaeota archaeon]|nr:hypothetical protein [Candidatus Aenigmarchaeota archaeon]